MSNDGYDKNTHVVDRAFVITAPADGAVLSERQFEVHGTGGQYSLINVYYQERGELVSVPADIAPDGTWIANITLPTLFEPLTFHATRRIQEDVVNSDFVTVRLASPEHPAVISPTIGSVQHAMFTLRGTNGTKNGKIRIRDRETQALLGESDELSETTWTCPVTATLGERFFNVFTVKFDLEFAGYQEVRYTIIPIIRPKITSPDPLSSVSPNFTVSGVDGIAGATLILRNKLLDITLVEKPLALDGDWSIDVDGLALGRYTIDARQKLGELESDVSASLLITVVPSPKQSAEPGAGNNGADHEYK
ncbi:MAG: hypothetical protein ACOH2P_15595 [Pseudomonas sp.]